MAKDNVNVADELKDEKQKANLTQSAKEAESAQTIAGTDTDEEATTNEKSRNVKTVRLSFFNYRFFQCKCGCKKFCFLRSKELLVPVLRVFAQNGSNL